MDYNDKIIIYLLILNLLIELFLKSTESYNMEWISSMADCCTSKLQNS